MNNDVNKKGEVVLVAGNGNPELADKISKYLETPLTPTVVETFSNGEIQIKIEDNVRLSDAFVIQPTCSSPNLNATWGNGINSVNDNLAELLLLIDALYRSSVSRITAVIPHYAYARQDRKDKPRVPISAKMWADCIQGVGAKRVIGVEFHSGQIQGFFNIPVDNLYFSPVLLDYVQEKFSGKKLAVVSPDAGGVVVARAFAKKLDANLAIIDKNRIAPGVAEAMAVIGDVKDRVAIVLDDMIDTAGTLCGGADALDREGAIEVHAAACHAILSAPAVERINNSIIKSVVVTDTIPVGDEVKRSEKFKILTMSKIIGEAIIRSHNGDSVTSLFV